LTFTSAEGETAGSGGVGDDAHPPQERRSGIVTAALMRHGRPAPCVPMPALICLQSFTCKIYGKYDMLSARDLQF